MNRDSQIEEIIREHYPQVFRLLYSMCLDKALSEDLAQETFLRWIKKAGGYQEQGKLKYYLFRIAVNLLHDHQRRLRPQEVYEEVADVDESMDGALWFYRHEEITVLNSWIERLPEALKEVILLHNLQEMTFDETAGILEVPVSTVKSRYKKALYLLKEMAVEYQKSGKEDRYEHSDREH